MSIFDYKNNFKAIEEIPCTLEWEHPDAPESPEVSIIMPVYLNHTYFRLALESALKQDCKESYEIVVVDNDTAPDNPNQKIIEQFADPRVRYYRNAENIGMVGNWNRGILKARGRLVTFLHDDDLFMPTTLSTALSVARRHPGKGVIATLRPINGKGELLDKDYEYMPRRRMLIFKPKEVAKVSLQRAMLINLGNGVGSIFTRENLIVLGGFAPDSAPIPDYNMQVRYCHKFGLVKMRNPSAYYRYADKNESRSVYAKVAPKNYENQLDIVEKIHLPNWFLKKIANIFYRMSDTNYRRMFAPKEEQVSHHISDMERRVYNLYWSALNLIEAYKITL